MTEPTCETERAAVVAWLRVEAKEQNLLSFQNHIPLHGRLAHETQARFCTLLADAIERGEHHERTGK